MYVPGEVFVLIALFALKHFLADYPLQNNYMLGKFKPGWGSVKPLFAHCAVHALFTAAILGLFSLYIFVAGGYKLPMWKVGVLAGGDFILHAIMDKVKASPKLLGRYKPLNAQGMGKALKGLSSAQAHRRVTSYNELKSNKYFWWSLGFDQMFHHLTDLAVIYFIFTWGFGA